MHYEIAATATWVEAWSSVRLPFEPKGEAKKLKRELQSRLLDISPGDSCLHAVYMSTDRRFCDVENVLLYNVGAGAFARHARSELRFERSFESPPCSPSGKRYGHYSRYSTDRSTESFQGWNAGDLIASWTGARLAPRSSSITVASTWLAMKRAVVEVTRSAEGKQFGADIQLLMPQKHHPNLAGLVKSLLDGVFCSLHQHDGSEVDEASRRLSGIVGECESSVAQLLQRGSDNALGVRAIVRLRQGDSVIWNPADDLCVAARVRREVSNDGVGCECRGQLYLVDSV